jgi:hypothetical protein
MSDTSLGSMSAPQGMLSPLLDAIQLLIFVGGCLISNQKCFSLIILIHGSSFLLTEILNILNMNVYIFFPFSHGIKAGAIVLTEFYYGLNCKSYFVLSFIFVCACFLHSLCSYYN